MVGGGTGGTGGTASGTGGDSFAGDGDGEKRDKDDGKVGAIISSDGVSTTYHCSFDGKKRTCKKATPTCAGGTIPVPGGKCAAPGPTAGSIVSGPGETVITSNGKSVSFQRCNSNADGTSTCTSSMRHASTSKLRLELACVKLGPIVEAATETAGPAALKKCFDTTTHP